MSKKSNSIVKMVIAAMFLALAMVLPLITGHIQQIGQALCPMHIPVLLCGFFCGPWYGLAVGFIAPLLRSVIFGMPPMMPSAVGMAFELATYGLMTGLLYKLLPKKVPYIYVSLIVSMITGRIVWGLARTVISGLSQYKFGWQAFVAGAFIDAIPGIILHIVLIPVLVIAIKKAFPKFE